MPNLKFDSWNKRFGQDIFMINSQKRSPNGLEHTLLLAEPKFPITPN